MSVLPGIKSIVISEVKPKLKEEVATPVSESDKFQKEDEKIEDGAHTSVKPKEKNLDRNLTSHMFTPNSSKIHSNS